MTEQAAAGDPASTKTEALRFHHSGKFGELLPIALLNFVLTIVTIGIYRFWARTRVRKYLWSKTTFLGDALEYRGKGSELFIGFLLSVLAFIVPLIVINVAIQVIFGKQSPLLFIYLFVVYFFIFWLFGYALYSAQRFRMSRTYWRGIRAGLDGTRSDYAWKFLGYGFLSALTLGLVTPVRDVALYRHVMNNASFGNRYFSYKGNSGPVYGAFFLSIILLIVGGIVYFTFAGGLIAPLMGPVEISQDGEIDPELFMRLYLYALAFALGFGIVMALAFSVYQARLVNHFVDELTLDGASFSLSPRADPLSFAWLVFGNILIIGLTLGIGLPFAQMRIFHYIVNRLQMDEAIDFDGIEQNQLKPPKYGEGLAELFDAGTI